MLGTNAMDNYEADQHEPDCSALIEVSLEGICGGLLSKRQKLTKKNNRISRIVCVLFTT